MSRLRAVIPMLLVASVGVAIGFGINRFPAVTGHDASAAKLVAAEGRQSTAANHLPPISSGTDRFTQLVSALGETKSLAGRGALFRVISTLSATEITGLIERAKTLPLKYRKELVAALFERWITIDRANAESWIRQPGRSEDCYEAWVRTDPRAAVDHLLTHANDEPRYSIISEALEMLAGKDSQSRVNILAQFPRSPASNDLLLWEFQQWSRADPATALNWLGVLPDDKYRRMLTETALTDLARINPEAATKRIQEMIPKLKATAVGNGFVSNFARSLAEKDPMLAMKFAEQLPEELRLYPLIAAGSSWARTDPVAALDWAMQNGIDPTERFRTESQSTSTKILGEAMSSNPSQTFEWLLALPEGFQRDRLVKSVLFETRGPAKGELNWKLFNSLSPEAQLQCSVGMGVELVSNGEFPTMDKWVSMFPEEQALARAIGGAVQTIFDKTPARAEAFVSELPEGSTRDRALVALTTGKAFATPVAAASSAMEIRDPIVRYDALDRLMTQWMDRDRQSAETWLDKQTDLPQEWVSEWRAIDGRK